MLCILIAIIIGLSLYIYSKTIRFAQTPNSPNESLDKHADEDEDA